MGGKYNSIRFKERYLTEPDFSTHHKNKAKKSYELAKKDGVAKARNNCKSWDQSLRRIGSSVDDYHKRLKEQNNVCAICKKEPPGKTVVFRVDHNHVTGKIRGLLCVRCNVILGMACDDPDILDHAAKYLRRHMED